MKSFWIAVVVAGVLTAGAAAQGSGASASGNASASANANSNANGSSASLSSGTNVQAELTKSLDAKKAKVGDEVTARVTQDVKSNGQVAVKKGSKLVGHITDVKTRSQGESESRLGIAFDRAVLKDGQQIAFNAVVQALAPPVSAGADDSALIGGGAQAPAPTGGGGASGGNMGTGPVGAVGSTVGRTVGNTAGTVTGTASGTVNGAGGVLNGNSHGVIGLQGLTLNSTASGSAQGSVISSNSRNVKLDSGTQMVLQVNGAAQ